MTSIPGTPGTPGGGSLTEKAARPTAEMETKKAQAQARTGAASAGPRLHSAAAGETLADIAANHGVTPNEIWEHPRNQRVREERGASGALQAGDALYIPGPKPPPLEPVGEGDYVVQAGDCMASIARNKGYFWKTIWENPGNSRLRTARQYPNVLLAGDRVVIPERTPKQEPGETELRHRFVRRGEPAALNLCVCVAGRPMANQPYLLVIDGDRQHALRGMTDPNGKIDKIPVPGNAHRAVLIVGSQENPLVRHLNLGNMSPKQDVKGVQRRLMNLGFGASESGTLDAQTREAIRTFQRAASLPVTGETDTATEDKLREMHGS